MTEEILSVILTHSRKDIALSLITLITDMNTTVVLQPCPPEVLLLKDTVRSLRLLQSSGSFQVLAGCIGLGKLWKLEFENHCSLI